MWGGRNQSRARNVERKYLGAGIISVLPIAISGLLTWTKSVYPVGIILENLGLPEDPHGHPNLGMVSDATSRDYPCDIGRDMTCNRAFPLPNFALALAKLPPFRKLLSQTWDKNYAFPQPVVTEELTRVFVSQPHFQCETGLWDSPHDPFAIEYRLEVTSDCVGAVFQNLSLERTLGLGGVSWMERGPDVGVRRKAEDIAHWNVLSSVDRDLDRIPRHGQRRSRWSQGLLRAYERTRHSYPKITRGEWCRSL